MAATHIIQQLKGRVFWFDPGGAGGAPPDGVEQARWNPLNDVRSWDDARSVAARLAGPSRPARDKNGGGGDHWIDRAEAWLAVLLYAASSSHAALSDFAGWCTAPTAACDQVIDALVAAELSDPTAAAIAVRQHDSLLNTPDRNGKASPRRWRGS